MEGGSRLPSFAPGPESYAGVAPILAPAYSPAMTGWRLVGRIVTTLLAILAGVPVLVIVAANLGLDPRHWSGTRLSGVELSSYETR